MSHTLTVKSKFLDPAAVEAAAREMGIQITRGTVQLYASKHENCLGLTLPGWRFPVAVDTKTGEAHFDNYGGKWGEQSQLDRFTQLYATHKATLFARSKGLMVQRTVQSNGNIKLQLTGAM